MRRSRREGIYLLLGIVLLTITLGYAYLQANLSINGTTNVSSANWNIYWDNIVLGSNNVTDITTPATINTGKTEVAFNVNFKEPGDTYEFTVDAVNDGTIDAMIDTFSKGVYAINGTTPKTLPDYLEYTVTYSDAVAIQQNHLLSAGTTETYKVRVHYKEDITATQLPSTADNYVFKFGVTYKQADDNAVEKPQPPTIEKVDDYSNRSKFRSDTYREKIKIVNLSDNISPPSNIIESWDIGVAQNGNVMAYITTNNDDNTMYDLYIQGNGHLSANSDSSNLFYNLRGVDSINGIDKLDTSKVTNMSSMFDGTGYSSTVFTLDLGDKFDTSKVTNMHRMFYSTGHNSPVFTLDLGDKFDTCKVTNMFAMFASTGYNSTVFTLDLGDKFDTSDVTNMSSMFSDTGYNDPVFTLDLGNKFDTSNVTNMSSMFDGTGSWGTAFTLDLGNKFDTSNVTDMSGMFASTGYFSPVFTLDLGDHFDTSNVTNIKQMFRCTGFSNSNLVLDLSSFDFGNVTSYTDMFYGFKTSQKIYVKNASDRDWVINTGNSNLTTSNVLIKSS